jgi:hypothetical protein
VIDPGALNWRAVRINDNPEITAASLLRKPKQVVIAKQAISTRNLAILASIVE